MQARIRPGYKSFVRTQPGADQGEAVGYLRKMPPSSIVGGPYQTQGDTDTIVWWYVRTPTGVEGWTPANTSSLTLLGPAE